MRASILTIAITCLGFLQLFGQDEVEFKVRKTEKSEQRYFYQTKQVNRELLTVDTVTTNYITKLGNIFQWHEIEQRDNTKDANVTPEYSFAYDIHSDNVSINYGTGADTDKKRLFFVRQLNTPFKGDFSFSLLFSAGTQKVQNAVLLDSALLVKIDSSVFSCSLILLTLDTMVVRDRIKLKSGRIGTGKRKEYIYTYCYLRNSDYLPVQIIETYTTTEPASRDLPTWLVNKFWLLKYHT